MINGQLEPHPLFVLQDLRSPPRVRLRLVGRLGLAVSSATGRGGGARGVAIGGGEVPPAAGVAAIGHHAAGIAVERVLGTFGGVSVGFEGGEGFAGHLAKAGATFHGHGDSKTWFDWGVCWKRGETLRARRTAPVVTAERWSGTAHSKAMTTRKPTFTFL